MGYVRVSSSLNGRRTPSFDVAINCFHGKVIFRPNSHFPLYRREEILRATSRFKRDAVTRKNRTDGRHELIFRDAELRLGAQFEIVGAIVGGGREFGAEDEIADC